MAQLDGESVGPRVGPRMGPMAAGPAAARRAGKELAPLPPPGERPSLPRPDTPVAGYSSPEEEMLIRQAAHRIESWSDYWADQFQRYWHNWSWYSNDQWNPDIAAERQEEGRPLVTANLIGPFVDGLVNEFSDVKFHVNVTSLDQSGEDFSMFGSDDEVMFSDLKGNTLAKSKVWRGLIARALHKNDGYRQMREALKETAVAGISFLHVTTAPAGNALSEDVELQINKVPFATSCLADPFCRESNFADMSGFFRSEYITRDMAEREYGVKIGKDGRVVGSNVATHNALEWAMGSELLPSGQQNIWADQDSRVRVVECYDVRAVDEERVFLENGVHIGFEEYDRLAEAGPDGAFYVNGIRAVKAAPVENFKRVLRFLAIRGRIVDGPYELPGGRVPYFMLTGKMIVRDERKMYASLMEFAYGMQEVCNANMTAIHERLSLDNLAPFLADQASIEGHKDDWEAANRNMQPFLLYNSMPSDGIQRPAPQRITPTEVSQSQIQLVQLAQDYMKSIVGVFNAGLGARSNEVSGKAILARQNESDLATSGFPSGLRQVVEDIGRYMLAIGPRYYAGDRIVGVEGEDGEPRQFRLNQLNRDTGQTDNDMLRPHHLDLRVSVTKSDYVRSGEFYTVMQELLKGQAPEVVMSAAIPLIEDMNAPNSQKTIQNMLMVVPEELLTEEQRKLKYDREIAIARDRALADAAIDSARDSVRQELGLPPPEPPPEVIEAQAKARTAEAKANEAEAKLRLLVAEKGTPDQAAAVFEHQSKALDLEAKKLGLMGQRLDFAAKAQSAAAQQDAAAAENQREDLRVRGAAVDLETRRVGLGAAREQRALQREAAEAKLELTKAQTAAARARGAAAPQRGSSGDG